MAEKQTPSKTHRSSPGKGGGGKGGSGGGGGSGGDGGDEREPPGEEPDNLDIHEAYLRYRLEGGERPTTQAYARAFAQFKKLPGAVSGKPTVKPPEPNEEGEEGQTGGAGDKP